MFIYSTRMSIQHLKYIIIHHFFSYKIFHEMEYIFLFTNIK